MMIEDELLVALLDAHCFVHAANILCVPASTLRSHLTRHPESLEKALDIRALELRAWRNRICRDHHAWDAVRTQDEVKRLAEKEASWLSTRGEWLLAKARAEIRWRELAKPYVDSLQ